MKKILVLFGNFTFHHFSPEELELFKNKTESDAPDNQKALLHSVDAVWQATSKEDVDRLVEKYENQYEGWVVPSEFKGEIVFEPSPTTPLQNIFGQFE